VTLATTFGATPVLNQTPRTTLDIYFIDVEGGQATLIVTPTGESLLIDAGYPSTGTFASMPGDPAQARDPQRILAAARHAGMKQIDYLMLSHYHADHAGGVAELAQLLPIRTFIDHGQPGPNAEQGVAGTQAVYDAYAALAAKGTRLSPRPGDRLPIKGIDAVMVAADGKTIETPLAGGGQRNPACVGTGVPAQEKTENPLSAAVRIQFGQFRFLDLGDLTDAPLFALACPVNLIGESDVYLITHHGGADAADPSFFAAVRPRIAVFGNGVRKGAQAEVFATLRTFPSIETWQTHRTLNAGAENSPDDRIANLDETTSAWLKLSANEDGSFTVTNGRTGVTKAYAARSSARR
jgi:competence protein ComEC